MGAVVEVKFEHGSPRASKARLGKSLGGLNERLLVVVVAVMLVSGVIVLALGVSTGWLLLGLASWPAIVVKWYKGELKRVDANKHPNSIDDILDPAILARIPRQPSPKDVAIATSQTTAGLFFAARFGVTPNFLSEIASPEQSDTDLLWKEVLSLHDDMNDIEISAGMIVYALLKLFPDHQAVLAHNHLELDDIKQGISRVSQNVHGPVG